MLTNVVSLARHFLPGQLSCLNRSGSSFRSRPGTPSCRALHSACLDFASGTCQQPPRVGSRVRTSTQPGTYRFPDDNLCESTVGTCSCQSEGRWSFGVSLHTSWTTSTSTNMGRVLDRLWSSTRWLRKRSPLAPTGCGGMRIRARAMNGFTILMDCSLDLSAPKIKRVRRRISKPTVVLTRSMTFSLTTGRNIFMLQGHGSHLPRVGHVRWSCSLRFKDHRPPLQQGFLEGHPWRSRGPLA
jgi:hypothetical protein